MNQPDISKRVLIWLRWIGFGGLATIVAAVIAVNRMQLDNQLNIHALLQQQVKSQKELENLSAAVVKLNDEIHVQQYRIDEAERRLQHIEGAQNATGNR
ncbi:hypothetical protein GZZ44_10515 [Klebsiella aerogenes]|uniref:hypothetical protein n=1 Tax=Klebsiella aerogenes TaxID=548 RepID=UPI00190E6E03|nr:hypothetical protein [Klebsiella aerogenes]MBK0633380.1 hypothetical protein [Klebsiella aerogenes]